MMKEKINSLWLRWTLANALSELVGLGATFAVTGFLLSRMDVPGMAGMLLAFAFSVLSGAIEATVVGLAQWWAMHPWFPMIRPFRWWRATFIGALAAYVLGYLPSTLMDLMDMEASAAQTPQAEPAAWLTLLLAAGLGAVAGAVLAFAQGRELRRHVRRANLWLPANMLAWAAGMPVIFWGMDIAFQMPAIWQSVLVVGTTLLVVGTLVGAIHGRFLVVLARDKMGRE